GVVDPHRTLTRLPGQSQCEMRPEGELDAGDRTVRLVGAHMPEISLLQSMEAGTEVVRQFGNRSLAGQFGRDPHFPLPWMRIFRKTYRRRPEGSPATGSREKIYGITRGSVCDASLGAAVRLPGRGVRSC